MYWLPFLFILFVFDQSISCLGDDGPIADTEYGKVKGTVMKSVNGRNFFAFRGIPYAKPPVGDLRFKEPQKPPKHEDILEATTDSDDCLQLDLEYNSYPYDPNRIGEPVGKEDCLYLNVYTPNLHPPNPLPVMFNIHGGGFVVGSGSSEIFGPQFLMEKEIVLVTINYRLGVFGFLSLENELLPGNLGLKDQLAALEWVKNNIKYFGGNPNSVTILGESAGAASVHLHMMSSKSKGLFHRAISQSGNMYSPWALAEKGTLRAVAISIAKLMQCPPDDAPLLDCLKTKPAEEIILTFKKVSTTPFAVILTPILEMESNNSFITEKSIQNPSSIPWLTGVNSLEGLVVYSELFCTDHKDLINFKENYKAMLPQIVSFSENAYPNITDKIKNFYLGEKEFSNENLNEIVDMFSDGLFFYPHFKASKQHNGTLFMYYYTHKGERGFNNKTAIGDVEGADHGDELFSLFYVKKYYPEEEYNKNDSKISSLMVNFWTNFASFGKPVLPDDELSWEESGNKRYLQIATEDMTMKEEFFPERMKFWENLFA